MAEENGMKTHLADLMSKVISSSSAISLHKSQSKNEKTLKLKANILISDYERLETGSDSRVLKRVEQKALMKIKNKLNAAIYEVIKDEVAPLIRKLGETCTQNIASIVCTPSDVEYSDKCGNVSLDWRSAERIFLPNSMEHGGKAAASSVAESVKRLVSINILHKQLFDALLPSIDDTVRLIINDQLNSLAGFALFIAYSNIHSRAGIFLESLNAEACKPRVMLQEDSPAVHISSLVEIPILPDSPKGPDDSPKMKRKEELELEIDTMLSHIEGHPLDVILPEVPPPSSPETPEIPAPLLESCISGLALEDIAPPKDSVLGADSPSPVEHPADVDPPPGPSATLANDTRIKEAKEGKEASFDAPEEEERENRQGPIAETKSATSPLPTPFIGLAATSANLPSKSPPPKKDSVAENKTPALSSLKITTKLGMYHAIPSDQNTTNCSPDQPPCEETAVTIPSTPAPLFEHPTRSRPLTPSSAPDSSSKAPKNALSTGPLQVTAADPDHAPKNEHDAAQPQWSGEFSVPAEKKDNRSPCPRPSVKAMRDLASDAPPSQKLCVVSPQESPRKSYLPAQSSDIRQAILISDIVSSINEKSLLKKSLSQADSTSLHTQPPGDPTPSSTPAPDPTVVPHFDHSRPSPAPHNSSNLVNKALNWLNFHLKEKNIEVKNLETDLGDGLYLIYALENCTGETIKKCIRKPMVPLFMLENISNALSFLASKGVHTGSVAPNDILEGNRSMILVLFGHIIRSFPIGSE